MSCRRISDYANLRHHSPSNREMNAPCEWMASRISGSASGLTLRVAGETRDKDDLRGVVRGPVRDVLQSAFAPCVLASEAMCSTTSVWLSSRDAICKTSASPLASR